MLSNQTTTTVAVSLGAATLAWIGFSSSRWKSSLIKFRNQNHGYTTSSSEKANTLLVVCPASGGGKAMKTYTECVTELESRGLQVEVYVTESTQDLINLTVTKDFKPYTSMIAVLGGDSSLYEMIQMTMRATNGKWPYAPILVLPGGSSNVLSTEFHGLKTSVPDIVEKAAVVRNGSVIKSSSPGATPRYTVHVAFDGCQRTIIEEVERTRSTLYAAFGKIGLFSTLITCLLRMPFMNHDASPGVLSVVKSDQEAEGIDFNFGVNRFDNKMIVIYQSQYKGVWNLIKLMSYEMSGQLGQDYRDGKKPVVDGLTVKVTDKSFTVSGDGHYRVFSDGTSVLPIEGESMTFEVVTEAIPYFVFVEKDLPTK